MAKYAAWEMDLHSDAPKVFTGLFALYELCFTIRTRARVPLYDISLELNGLDIRELERMENGQIPCAALAAFWQERGLL